MNFIPISWAMIHASLPSSTKSHSAYTFATLAAVHHIPPAPSPERKACLWIIKQPTPLVLRAEVIRGRAALVKPRPHPRNHAGGRTSWLIKLTRVLGALILYGPSGRTLLDPSFLSMLESLARLFLATICSKQSEQLCFPINAPVYRSRPPIR